MSGRIVLGDVLDSEQNSFNLVRLAMACAVLVSHCYGIPAGTPDAEPLAGITLFNLGQHAVNAFFVISGLTLSQSIARNPDLIHYSWSRILRIYPALIVYGIIFAFAAGPFLTSLPPGSYFSDPHTWLYPAAVTVAFANAPPPPEIFASAPYAGAVNTPLWTIKYELIAYVGLAGFSCLNLQRAGLFGAMLLAFAGLVLAGLTPGSEATTPAYFHLARYAFCFLLGMAAYRYRAQLWLAPWLLAIPAGVVLMLRGTALEAAADIILAAHLVLVAGGRNYGLLSKLTRRDDLSYGTYIYGWPVQQTLVMLLTPAAPTAILMALTFAIVPLFAFASWHLIEKPMLRLKRTDPRNFLSRLRARWKSV